MLWQLKIFWSWENPKVKTIKEAQEKSIHGLPISFIVRKGCGITEPEWNQMIKDVQDESQKEDIEVGSIEDRESLLQKFMMVSEQEFTSSKEPETATDEVEK